MKILINFVILSIILSFSESYRHYWSTSSDSSDSSLSTSYSSSSSSSSETSLESKYKNVKKGVYLKGRLRRQFLLELATRNPGRNFVCSPISALLPLGKLALGTEGQSRKELYEAIGISSHREISKTFKKLMRDLITLPGVTLCIASSIFVSVSEKINKKYFSQAKDIFNSAVEVVSFVNPTRAANEINRWVSRNTKALIPTIIEPSEVSSSTSMVLVNAIYFKGRWQNPFRKVEVEDFFSPSGTKKVQMMSRTGYYNYTSSDTLRSQIIEIPYKESHASFIIVLPFEKMGIHEMLKKLKGQPKLLDKAISLLRPQRVSLSLPKYKTTMKLDLKVVYKKIGLRNIFQTRSGIKRIINSKELEISTAIQKAIIEVHEHGTEAAAATGVEIIPMALHLNQVMFRADHPFLFYVQANKEQLFGGVYYGP